MAMDYERAYKDSFDQCFKYKDMYLKEATEEETESLLKDLGGPFISEEEYEDIILPFWAKYNKKPNKNWFDLYCSRDKIIDPKIVPIDLYLNEIVPYLNNLQLRFAIADKCNYDVIMAGIKQPETICKCTASFYFDSNNNMITRAEAIKLCLNHNGKFIIKPSVNTNNSKNVYSIDPTNMSEKDIDNLFEQLGAYFIVQHKIEQHPELAKLSPDGVNTIRVNSILTDGGVYIPSVCARVAGPNQQIIEQGSGGWSGEIDKDSTLYEKILINNINFYKDQDGADCVMLEMKWQELPENIRKETGYKIPAIDKMCAIVKDVHKRLPHFRWIGWDFTVDTSGEPVFIEYNFVPGYRVGQLALGRPMFGDMTEEILDDCYIYKRLERNKLGRLL